MVIKVEIFTSQPPCSGGRLLLRLIDDIKKEYGDAIDVEIYKGPCDKAKEYKLEVSPAVVIDKDIRIIGICPSKETFKDALREAGL